MTEVVVKLAEVLNFAAKRPAAPATPTCPHCGASRMVRSYVRHGERWRGTLLNRSPFRCVTCSHRSWHQATAVSSDVVEDQAWRDACRRPDVDALDLSEVDQQLQGVPQPTTKIAGVAVPVIDWQIVALVRNIGERIKELQARQHGTPRGYRNF